MRAIAKVGLVAAGTSLAAAAGVIGVAMNSSSPAQSSAVSDMTPPAAAYPWAPEVSGETLEAMRRYAHTTFKPADAGENANVELRADDAVRAAAGSLGFLNQDGGRVDVAQLGYLTNQVGLDSAAGLSRDPADAESPGFAFNNKLVWLVTFKGFTAPVTGSLFSSTDRPSDWPTGKSRMWVAIDPNTGEFLGARTIVTDPGLDAKPTDPAETK